MKLVAILTAGGLSALSIAFGQRAGQFTPRTVTPSARLQLHLEVDPSTAGPGAQVFAKLTLKNISEKAVSIEETSPHIDYNVTVVDAAGREPERTDWGKRKLSGPISIISARASRLQPGEERRATVEITGVYGLSQPGTYYVKVGFGNIYQDDPEGGRKIAEVAYSNAAEVKIVSPDASPVR